MADDGVHHLPWRGVGVGAVLGAAALYAGLTLAITWPLFRHPATSVLDASSLHGEAQGMIQRDINLTLWVLAWGAHGLATDPAGLFDANAFYPARRSLAFSEHMLGNAPLFAPVFWLTGNPVLALNATSIASFVLAGLTMAAWMVRVTGDRVAALAAGCFFAFAPFRLWQVGSLHVISIQYLPLVMLGIDGVLDRRRWGPLALGTGLVLSTLCAFYVGYAAWLLAATYAAVAIVGRGRAAAPRLGPLVATALVAACAIAIVSLPYLRLARAGVLPDFQRSGFQSLAFVAAMQDGPLGTIARFVRPLGGGIPTFQGWTILAFGAVAVLVSTHVSRRALAAVGLAGVVLACGPILHTALGEVTLPYGWLADVLPGFATMRVPQRFASMTTVATAALAGLGLAALRGALRRRGRGGIAGTLAAVAVAGALVEARPATLVARPMDVESRVPAAYRWLAEHGEGGALLELPGRRGAAFPESFAMYHSIYHWLPLANGYTPYPPPEYTAIMEAAERMPSRAALRDILAVAPFRWLLVRRGIVAAGTWPMWEATLADAGYRQAEQFGGVYVFEGPVSR